MRFLRWFLTKNRAICERLAGFLPHTKTNIFEAYEDIVISRLQDPQVHLVADMGAGNYTPWSDRRPQQRQLELIGVDISEEAMERNAALDKKVVANITEKLPFEDGEVDLITSRSVLEHLEDVQGFVTEANRVLRDGGHTAHLFTGGFAWFALLNRLLNNRLAKRLLYLLHPDSRLKGGFPTHYDRCNYTAIRLVFKRSGFDILDIRVAYGTNYTFFFVPLFLLVSIYEMALLALRLRNLAATYVVIARKPLPSSAH